MHRDGRKRTRLALAAGVAAILAVAFGVATAISTSPESSSAATAASQDPFAGYVAPTGAELSSDQLQAIAMTRAESAGEPNPSEMSVAKSSLRAAMGVVEPQSTLPSSPTAGQAAWLSSTVHVIVMHGKFTLDDAPTPQNSAAPGGSVMELVVDAHTGFVDGRYVGPSVPAPLDSLGTVTPLA